MFHTLLLELVFSLMVYIYLTSKQKLRGDIGVGCDYFELWSRLIPSLGIIFVAMLRDHFAELVSNRHKASTLRQTP